jgi:plastocyanin
MRKTAILLASLSVLVVGCGGGSSSSQPVKLSGTTTDKGTKDVSGNAVELELDDFYFSPTFLKGGTPGSTLTVHLKNDGHTPHTFTSSAFGVDKTLQPGETADVQVTLPQSGATEFHCKFHQQSNGMQGAFFFNSGDALIGAPGAAPGGASSTSSSSSSSAGGYDYN